MDELYCARCRMEPVWRDEQTLCDTCCIIALEAERDALKDILRDVWNQFAIVAHNGHRWSGGLSVLDDVRQAIGGEE